MGLFSFGKGKEAPVNVKVALNNGVVTQTEVGPGGTVQHVILPGSGGGREQHYRIDYRRTPVEVTRVGGTRSSTTS